MSETTQDAPATEEWPPLPEDYDPGKHAPDLPLEDIDDAPIAPAPEGDRQGWIYPYTPHPKQELAGEYLVDEMLFGGAAGPGKTDWMLAECVNLCLAVPNSKVLLLRATYGELQEEIIPRLEARIPKWVGSYSTKANAFVFYNGARLRLGYMARDEDKK